MDEYVQLSREVPDKVYEHFRDRVFLRTLTMDDLQEILDWVDIHPLVFKGDWFRRFSKLTILGRDEYILSVLDSATAAAVGKRII